MVQEEANAVPVEEVFWRKVIDAPACRHLSAPAKMTYFKALVEPYKQRRKKLSGEELDLWVRIVCGSDGGMLLAPEATLEADNAVTLLRKFRRQLDQSGNDQCSDPPPRRERRLLHLLVRAVWSVGEFMLCLGELALWAYIISTW